MTNSQRCVIRADLVADAKLIQQRLALRSWGDAVNTVFATYRHLYLDDRQPPPTLPPPTGSKPQPTAPSPQLAALASAELVRSAAVPTGDTNDRPKPDFKQFVTSVDCSLNLVGAMSATDFIDDFVDDFVDDPTITEPQLF